MAGFVQIIEFQTSDVDAIEALSAEISQSDQGTVLRATVVADRDRPGHFMNIVEFESYESAMENSARPEIGEFSGKMAALCDGPPTFYNLDLVRAWENLPA